MEERSIEVIIGEKLDRRPGSGWSVSADDIRKVFVGAGEAHVWREA